MTKESKTKAPASPAAIGDRMSSKGFQWKMPATVAALTAAFFSASAAREWAYYHVIGVDFISLVAPADYTSAALRWLPAFVLQVAILAVLEMFLLRTEGFQSEEAIASRSPNPQRTMFFRALPFHLALTVMIVGGFLSVALADNPTAKGWLFPALGCWVVFIRWFLRHPYVYVGLTNIGRRLLLFGPVVAAFIIADGYDEAVRDLALPNGEYRIVHSTGLVEDDVQLLRTTSNGILILRVSTRDVSFLTFASFNRIDRIGSSE